jgi:hypothetical protein
MKRTSLPLQAARFCEGFRMPVYDDGATFTNQGVIREMEAIS